MIRRFKNKKSRYLTKKSNTKTQFGKQVTKALVLLTFCLALTIFVLGIFQIPNLLVISKIDCTSQYGECSGQLSDQSILLPKSYQALKKDFAANLLNSPTIESYRATFKFPNTLLLEIVERKPAFALKLKDKNLYAQVYQNGQIVKVVEENALPYVEAELLPAPGSFVTTEVLFALRLVSEISKSYDVVSSKIEAGVLVLEIENYQVLFPTTGDIEVLLGSFYTIYNQLNNTELGIIIGDRNLSLIDLRFENPVLKPNE